MMVSRRFVARAVRSPLCIVAITVLMVGLTMTVPERAQAQQVMPLAQTPDPVMCQENDRLFAEVAAGENAGHLTTVSRHVRQAANCPPAAASCEVIEEGLSEGFMKNGGENHEILSVLGMHQDMGCDPGRLVPLLRDGVATWKRKMGVK